MTRHLVAVFGIAAVCASTSHAAPPAPRATLTGHTGHVNAVAFSRDGKQLASAGDDGLRLWDVAARKEIATADPHSDSYSSIAWSADGKTIAGATGSGVILWDVGSAKRKKLNDGTSYNVIAYSPDGKTLIAAGRTFDVFGADGKLRATWAPVDGYKYTALAFSPDGKRLVVGSSDHTARILDAATGKEIQKIVPELSRAVTALAFTRDGTQLALGGDGLYLWDVAKAEGARTERDDPDVHGLAFTLDGKTLISGGAGGVVRAWDVATRAERGILGQHNTEATSVTMSLDGRSFVTASEDKTLKVWPAP